nr:MAG TPA: hypothetical protein [Caudoviricetes sp.]
MKLAFFALLCIMAAYQNKNGDIKCSIDLK